MELEKIPFSLKMKIKTIKKINYRQYITRFYQNMDIKVWIWTEKCEKTFLTFFKVEVYSVSSSFSVCSWQALAKISCRTCPQEIRVSCRGMEAHEPSLLSDICCFSISRIRSDDEYGVTDLPSAFGAACDILLHQRLMRNLIPLHASQQGL